MPLTQAQQELLTAWIDGQATGAEAEAASTLAAQPDAARWVQTTRALRALVKQQAAVQAPGFLKARVLATLDEDFDDISRPTASLVSLRRAGLALAAGLVLALGVYFVASGLPQETPSTGEIARQTTGHAPDSATGPGSLTPPGVQPAPPSEGGSRPGQNDSKDPGPDSSTGGAGGGKTPPPPGHDSETWSGDGNRRKHDGQGVTVLNLDRGQGNAHQVSLELDRNSGASPMQAYNDLLVVACMYADARLVNSEGSSAAVDNDFAIFDGLEIEVAQDSLADLLAAVRKLSDEQEYGSLALPEDLEQPVDDTERLVRELAEVRRDLASRDARNSDQGNETRADDAAQSVRGYLPPQIQTDQLRRESVRSEKADVMGRVDKTADSRKKQEVAPAAGPGLEKARKIKLVLRLQ